MISLSCPQVKKKHCRKALTKSTHPLLFLPISITPPLPPPLRRHTEHKACWVTSSICQSGRAVAFPSPDSLFIAHRTHHSSIITLICKPIRGTSAFFTASGRSPAHPFFAKTYLPVVISLSGMTPCCRSTWNEPRHVLTAKEMAFFI